MTANAQRANHGGGSRDRFEDYVPVAERLEKFYERFSDGRIITQIIEHNLETGFIVMRAEVYRVPDDAQPAATGHAFEVRGESFVNKNSYIENCETSAVGRALAILGFEIKRGVASREEMGKAARGGGGHLTEVTPDAAAVTPQGERATLLTKCGELFREMNKLDHRPEWTKTTIDTYVNGIFMVRRGVDDLSPVQLRRLIADLTEKRDALKQAGAAHPPAAVDDERERAVKIYKIEQHFKEQGWGADDLERHLSQHHKGVTLKQMNLDQLIEVCDHFGIDKPPVKAKGGAR